jgi:hypothetical protein
VPRPLPKTLLPRRLKANALPDPVIGVITNGQRLHTASSPTTSPEPAASRLKVHNFFRIGLLAAWSGQEPRSDVLPKTGLLENQTIPRLPVLLKPPFNVLLGVTSRFEMPIAKKQYRQNIVFKLGFLPITFIARRDERGRLHPCGRSRPRQDHRGRSSHRAEPGRRGAPPVAIDPKRSLAPQ